MTKLRPPISFEQAMDRIAGVMGWGGMATVLALTENAVRKKGDPDCPGSLTYDEAFRLDVAYHAAGGEGFPLHDGYALRLKIAIDERRADAAELVRAIGKAAREGGEAVHAMLAAAEPGANAFTRQTALREGQEAMDALTAAMAGISANIAEASTGATTGGECH
jgi:hypothetical protein